MRSEDIDQFVYLLSDFLNLRLAPQADMRNFFDSDYEYMPLFDFVHDKLEKFVTEEDNYN